MAPDRQDRRIPDVLLDRYLADDLPAAERARVQAVVDADPAVRQRLADIRAQQQAFLAENPAAPFAHQVAVHLAVAGEQERPSKRRRVWAWVLGPSLAAATTFLVVATVLRQTPETRIAATAVPVASAPSVTPIAEIAPAPTPQPRVFAQPPTSAYRAKLEAKPPEKVAESRDKEMLNGSGKGAENLRAKVKSRAETRSRPAATLGRRTSDDADQSREGQGAPASATGAATTGGPIAAQTAPKPMPSPPPPAGEPRDEPGVGGRVHASEAEQPAEVAASPGRSASAEKKGAAVDGLFDEAKISADAGSPPSKDDVTSVVRAKAKTLAPCLSGARARGELSPGKIVLVLDWDIRPDGTVNRPALVGPVAVAKTVLATCIARQMAGWRFPASGQTTPIRNFPLPVNLR